MKKVLGIIFIVSLLMSIMSMEAFAATSGKYEYTLDGNNNATITAYIGNGTEVTIPSILDGHSVTAIGAGVFFYNENLTSVTIPNTVTSIGKHAFGYCEALKSVTMSNSITSIDEGGFFSCIKLTSVTIPSSLNSIGKLVFYGCESLTSVTIPNGVTSIGEAAFRDCLSLESVIIPNSVTSIDDLAFGGCKNLTSVIIPSSVTLIDANAFASCTRLASVEIGNSNASIDESAFFDTPWGLKGDEFTIDENGVLVSYNGYSENIIIPNTVKSIASNAFSGNIIAKSIIIPEGVTSIGDKAFSDCTNLESVNIPNIVTYIGNEAFSSCESLKSVKIPNGITSISDGAFHGCRSLTSITLPNTITEIGAGAFNYCDSLTSFTIPNKVTKIGVNAFLACEKLISITIPASVTFADDSSPFGHCYKLTEINVDSNNPNYTSIDGILFNKNKTMLMQYPSDKAATSYTIPNTVTAMETYCFMFCKNLESIAIPDTITSISEGGFSSCSNLKALIIPSKVTEIGHFAFRECLSLKSITIPPSVTYAGEDLFRHCPNDMKIYGIAGSYTEKIATRFEVDFVAIKKLPSIETVPSSDKSKELVAVPSATKIVVNKVNVAVDSYVIDGNNYIKLRDLATMVNTTNKNFNVTWDGGNNAINLLSKTPYKAVGGEMIKGDSSSKKADSTTSKIYIDGKIVPLTAYNIDQNNYFKLRDVMKAFNIAVGYENETKTATLDTSNDYVTQ